MYKLKPSYDPVAVLRLKNAFVYVFCKIEKLEYKAQIYMITDVAPGHLVVEQNAM